MIIVSACLLGRNCKYDGGNNGNEAVKELVRGREVLAVCPETAAALPAPREPSERQGDRIVSRDGKDLTDAFRKGAEACFARVMERRNEIEFAVLKANSPSCGSGRIYDGTFTGRLVPGSGVFAEMLEEEGVPVYTEADAENGVPENE